MDRGPRLIRWYNLGMRVWDLPPLDSVSISIVRWRDWYGRFWLADSSVIQRQKHVYHKCRKRRFCTGGLERSLWARFWWPLSGNDDLGNSRWTEDFGARLSGTTDEETWKSSSPAERYCVLNKDDDSRESLCELLERPTRLFFFVEPTCTLKTALVNKTGDNLANYLI